MLRQVRLSQHTFGMLEDGGSVVSRLMMYPFEE
jgi:hypothetical protein